MPDRHDSSAPAAPLHPMDPRRGENLSPMFAAFLCWLLQLEPMTRPAITGISVSRDCVLAATTDDPFFNTHLGTLADFDRNLRDWADACGADSDVTQPLFARLARTGA